MLERVVRIGRIEGQDKWRREDCMSMTPDERLAALMEFRRRRYPGEMRSIARSVRIGGSADGR